MMGQRIGGITTRAGLTVDAKGNPILIYREGGKSNRPLDLAISTNGGASFARVARINQGESKVDS